MTSEIWEVAWAHLSAGEQVFMVWVADHTRHSPGTRGAKLALTRDGQTVGTVGGGIMEKTLLDRGTEALRRGELTPEVKTLHHHRQARADARSGMICAGHQTNVSLLLDPDRDLGAVSKVREALRDDQAALLRFSPGTGLTVHAEAPRRDIAPIRVVHTGDGWQYEEQLLSWHRAAIFGGGHCGQALSRLLVQLGYAVTVLDIRPELINPNPGGATHAMTVPDYTLAAARVTHPEITLAVVMTADFPSDVKALAGALKQPFPFLGVMGAPAKLKAIARALEDEHDFSQEALQRLVAPVGLPIGSSTPAEIAVSVAAQFLQERARLFPALAPSPLHHPKPPAE